MYAIIYLSILENRYPIRVEKKIIFLKYFFCVSNQTNSIWNKLVLHYIYLLAHSLAIPEINIKEPFYFDDC